MNRDPFLRLALIVACSLYVLGLVIAAEWLGFWEGALVYAGGTFVAVAVSITVEPTPPGESRFRRHRQPREGTAGFERIS